MIDSKLKKQNQSFPRFTFNKYKTRFGIFVRILLAIYFCGFVNYKITNHIVDSLYKNSFFEDTARFFIHACFSFLAIFALFPQKLPEELFRRKKNNFRFGMLLAVGFPICLLFPNIVLNLYFGATLSLFIPSFANITAITLHSLGAGIEEELVCRFLLFERLSQVLGTAISFVVQLLFFVVLHYTEHGMSLTRRLMLSVASLLFVALYRRTQSLTVVIALHFSYDFLLTLIFGGFLGETHFVGFIGSALLGEKYANYIKLVMVTALIIYLILSTKRIKHKEINN